MPVERTYIDGIKDFLTSPARVDAAFWEALQALYGESSIQTIWNVLFNPTAARPEDLRSFSERFLHLSPGWVKFIVDTAMNPLALTGALFARGSGILRLHADPTPAAKKYMETYAPLFDKLSVQPYAKLLDKMGFKVARGAEILMHSRMGQFYSQFVPRYEQIKRRFTAQEWSGAKARIALYLDGRAVPNITRAEIEAAEEIRNTILDPAWDLIGTIERLGSKDGDFVADVEPIGYLTSYFMHMQNKQGWLANDPRTIVRTIVDNPKYKQLLDMGKIRALPFTPDTSISLSSARAALLEWMQQPGAATIFNPFILKRTADAIPDELVDKLYILDLDRVLPSYIHRAARTYALQTPISHAEARVLHGRIPVEAVDVSEIPRLHAIIRQAWRNGDMATVDRAREQVQALYHRVRGTPEQHSLAYQVTMEAKQRVPGFDPEALAGGMFRSMAIPDPHQKIRARIFSEWYSLLIGKQDLERFTLGRAFATALSSLKERLTPREIQVMNNLGAKVGMPNFGTRAIDWITKYSDTYEAAGLERMLVSYTTANLLGLRPASVLTQIMQTPSMTMPAIGLGSTIAGITEGVPKLSRAFREGLRVWMQERRRGRPIEWKEALGVGFQKHLPEFVNAGIPLDMHMFERAYGESFTERGEFLLDKFISSVLLPFSMGEHLNRVIAFYGARHAFKNALRVNPKAFGYDMRAITAEQLERDMNLHAASIVYETQFVPTSGRLTPLLKRLGPTGRQFLTYPVGFANAIADMAIKGAIDKRAEQVGAALGQAFGHGRSWLGYARYLAVMAGLTNFGRDVLGMGLGERVQEGVINLPLDASTPFAPLPVPPIPGVVIAYLNSALTGKLDRGVTTDVPLLGELPIPKAFFPMGMLIAQSARLLNQTKDGMMISRDGRGLYDFDRKAFIASLLGLRTQESIRDDEKAKRLLLTQDRLTGYRHRLAMALANADMDTAQAVRAEYANDPLFRDAAQRIPLSVSPGDIVRVRELQKTTRLERIARSVGSQVRNIVDPMYDPAGWYEPYHMEFPSMAGESATTRGFN